MWDLFLKDENFKIDLDLEAINKLILKHFPKLFILIPFFINAQRNFGRISFRKFNSRGN